MTNPLEFLDHFRPHDGPLLKLPGVTTITVDDRADADSVRRLAEITRWHRRFMETGKEVILSGERPEVSGIDWIKLPKWKGHPLYAYSRWCQKELRYHFSTPHVMVWQADGFAINPSAWTVEFLLRDYTGSPCYWDRKTVGNGGFSIRSKRFCEEASKLPDCGAVPEDVYFCLHRRDEMARRGLKFAPTELARRWGIADDGTAIGNEFGFHGKNFLVAVSRRLCERFLIGETRRTLENGVRWDGQRFVRG